MQALWQNARNASSHGALLFDISCDSTAVQVAWVKSNGLSFSPDDRRDSDPMVLSDFWPHGAVSRLYGVFNEERGVAQRALFVIGRDGKVWHRELITERGKLPDIERAIEIAADVGRRRASCE